MGIKKAIGLGLSLLILPASAGCLTSCADKYDIWIWASDDHREVYLKAIENYRKENPDFKYTVGYSNKGDAGANSNVQKDVETAGSIIVFPNDQLVMLRRMGALSPLLDTDGHDDITWSYANHVEAAVNAAVIGDKHLAYPISADNGFVLMYNLDAFKDTSVWDENKNNGEGGLKEGYTFRDLYKALDEKATKDKNWENAKVIWPFGSAWYEAGAFFATGCDYNVEYDEKGEQKKVDCDFGDPDKGIEAARCMINTATDENGDWSSHFVYTDDSDPAYGDYITAHTGSGEAAKTEPLAGIISANNGTLRTNWGDKFRAEILPTLVSDSGDKWIGGTGTKYTWRSFSGFKLLCVNPFCRFAKQGDNVEVLHKLARYLTDKETSLLRYEATKLGPSNIHAAEDPEVKQDRFLTALNAQFNLPEDPETHKPTGYRTQDSTPKNFWTALANVGKEIWECSDKFGAGHRDTFRNMNVEKAQAFLKQVEENIKSTGN